MKKILLTALLLMGVAFHSQAGVLIEPQFNVSVSGDYEASGTAIDFAAMGTGFGARVGYSMAGLMFGVDYQTMGEETDTGAATELDINTTEIAAFIGYEFPVLFRVYAAYLLSGEFEQDIAGGATWDDGASGFKIGLGYKLLPFVSINLEHKMYEFEHENSIVPDIEYNSTVLAVSFPFDLM